NDGGKALDDRVESEADQGDGPGAGRRLWPRRPRSRSSRAWVLQAQATPKLLPRLSVRRHEEKMLARIVRRQHENGSRRSLAGTRVRLDGVPAAEGATSRGGLLPGTASPLP